MELFLFFRMGHFSCICTILLAVFFYTEAYVARIECPRKGYSDSTLYWDCKVDGTIKCTSTRRDCSSCKNDGRATTGSITYLTSGGSYLRGGSGWDCRRKCRRCPGCSGKEAGRVAEINCDYYNY